MNSLPVAARRTRRVGGFRVTDWSQPPSGRLGWHHHAAPSLSLVLAGRYLETYRGRAIECGPGDVVVKPAAERHRDEMGSRGARTLLVEVPALGDAELREAVGRLEAPLRRADAASRGLVWRCARELSRDDPWTPLALESHLLELLVHVGRRPAARRSPRPPWLERGLAYLREASHESIGLSDVARECGVHPAHLARAFRRHLGRSVGELLRELRLQRAMEELQQGQASVAEIARRTGFYDHSHLHRVLARHTGLTPSQLRRRPRRG